MAELMSSQYPRACEVITKDILVDDCLSGEDSVKAGSKTTDEFNLVFRKGSDSLGRNLQNI